MRSLIELEEEIEALKRRLSLSTENTFKPTPFEYEREAPLVTNLTNVARAAASGSTPVALTWEVPDDDRIEAFEIWSKNLSEDSPQWVLKGAVTHPPWGDNLIADVDKVVSFAVRTKLRNGLGTTIDNSPTVPVSITAPSDEITSASQIANGIVGNSKLDRTTDPISMTSADIANLAVGTAHIQNLAVTNAKINDLAAGKITAGTLIAGVAVLGTVLAQQIIGTKISGVQFETISGAASVLLSGGSLVSSGASSELTLNQGSLTINALSSSASMVFSLGAGITIANSSGNNVISLINTSSAGRVMVRDSSGTETIRLEGSSGLLFGTSLDVSGNADCGSVSINGDTGETVTLNAFPTQMVFKGGILTGYTP